MRRDLGVKTPDKINIDISVSMVLSLKRRCAIIGVKISEKEVIRMGMKTDILIVGSGCAGLYCALQLPRDKQILILSKADLEGSDSYLAQGGICMLKDESDYDSYFEDTMKAGHYENDRKSVEIMIRSSQDVIRDLVSYGAQFKRDEEGNFVFTREGAHSHHRILFHEDETGKEITTRLLEAVRKLPNVTLMDHTTMLDIVEKDNVCYGAVLELPDGSITTCEAEHTVWACGGIGGLYTHSTNYPHLTGDALAIAKQHNIDLKNVNYVQIHPTTLYSKKPGERSFLISESVRGEGARLYDKNFHRFTNELLPRDLLSKEILRQMKKDGTDFVWEDLRTIPREEVESHFPNIVEHCREEGYDVFKECIPVVPAQHYFMGGVKVDYVSKTTMDQLYAIGECACNGVHGRNRLASNSLLEALVFAKRAAKDIAADENRIKRNPDLLESIPLTRYADTDRLIDIYGETVAEEIDEEEKAHPIGARAEMRYEPCTIQ